jgi:hypothetical protein
MTDPVIQPTDGKRLPTNTAHPPSKGHPARALVVAVVGIPVSIFLLYGVGFLIADSMGFEPDHSLGTKNAVWMVVCLLGTALAVWGVRLGWGSRGARRGIAALVLSLVLVLANLAMTGWSGFSAVYYTAARDRCLQSAAPFSC